jgi:hypothetical protein
MKHSFTRRLMQGPLLSCSLFTLACNESGAPLSAEQLETASQELRRAPWPHVDIGSAAGGYIRVRWRRPGWLAPYPALRRQHLAQPLGHPRPWRG